MIRTVNLHKIFYKLGAYNMDPFTHANNVIESNSKSDASGTRRLLELAKECLELLGEEILLLTQITAS